MPRLAKAVLLLAVALASAPLSGAAADEPTADGAELRRTTAAAISAESEQKLRAAFECVYSLDFVPGRKLFEEVAEAEPASATVRAFWASALLYEILAYQGSLQSQLFVTTNEFLKHPRLPPDAALDQKFQAVVKEGLALAGQRLEANPNDPDGLFAAGLLYGDLANYAAGVQARYLDGVRLGEKAFDYHQRLRGLRPELHDTDVVLGVHDYILGSLPGVHRFFLFFAGVRGSRERGLGYFEEAARKGEFLSTYGQILLVVACIREQRLDRAAALLEDLHRRYPRNPVFALELARLDREGEKYAEATEVCHALLAELTAHPHNPRVVGPEDALLELGLIEAATGETPRALESLAEVDRVPDANPRVRARALLERGKLFDRLGEREKALAEYGKVIRLAAYPETTRLASLYTRQPYRPAAAN